jgi:hypothetical protein
LKGLILKTNLPYLNYDINTNIVINKKNNTYNNPENVIINPKKNNPENVIIVLIRP